MKGYWKQFIELEKECHSPCSRKLVVSALVVNGDIKFHSVNGNSNCSNKVGLCGCLHAEQRLLMQFMHRGWEEPGFKLHIIQRYSPCHNCANLLIEFCERFSYKLHIEYLVEVDRYSIGLDILGEKVKRYLLPSTD